MFLLMLSLVLTDPSQLKTKNIQDLDTFYTHVDEILAFLVNLCGDEDFDVDLMSHTQIQAFGKFEQ